MPILAFLCGILSLQQFRYLPSQYWVIIIVLGVALLKIFDLKYTKLLFPFLLGFVYCLCFAYYESSTILPTDLEGKTLTVIGTIASIPYIDEKRTVFLFDVKHNNNPLKTGLIHLSWQNAPYLLRAGETWQLPVRLKKIHSTLNPGGFDYEAWRLQENINATGYVLPKLPAVKLTETSLRNLLLRCRQSIRDKISANLPLSNTSPWITALAIGERHGLKATDWAVLRNTGTNHLMAIAGLHIGFMSLFIYSIIVRCWRYMPKLCLIMPAQQAGAIGGLLMAIVYSAMAGFSIPTKRACLMISFVLISLISRRKIRSWHALLSALFVILLINPFSVLSESFWLSFASVALIIYGMDARLSPKGLWWKYGRIQWVISLGLMPLTVWLFQQCALISIIANSIAIPWVGFIVVPLTLSGTFTLFFSEKIGGLILICADKALNLLWMILTYLANFSWSTWYQARPDLWMLVVGCIGILFLIMPIGFPGRFLGVLWTLPLILYQPEMPKSNEVWFTLLDVGQGLAAVIQTKHHVLVYDAGAKLSDQYDMGESVILPFLHSIGVKKIDLLVISHGDNDHIGGAAAVLQRMPTLELKTSVPKKFKEGRASLCLRGDTWVWDNVQFEFIYPTMDQLGLGNDSSCVLRVKNGSQSLLLTGDIEKFSENFLVNQGRAYLISDFLIAPHHGSKTSAVPSFIDAVNPKIVLFPIGYRNRYHFPHPSVIAKYKERKIVWYDTVNAGAIQLHITNNAVTPSLSLYRERHHRYWND